MCSFWDAHGKQKEKDKFNILKEDYHGLQESRS